MVAADYFKLPDHRGGAIDPGTRHYRMNGKEHTIGDVPFKHILEQVEKRIKEMPADRRTEMFKQVMADVPGTTKNPDWEREAINPNAEPATAFSTSKAVWYNPSLQYLCSDQIPGKRFHQVQSTAAR
jgi:hypothetical protein